MHTHIALTTTGADRVGITHDVTELLFGLNANVETSRMVSLGGEFALLMLFSLPSEQLPHLGKVTETLKTQGYIVKTTQKQQAQAESLPGWLSYQVDVGGADHEGILHQIAHQFSRYGINIEALESGTEPAPFGGPSLFTLSVHAAVPPSLPGQVWITALEDTIPSCGSDMVYLLTWPKPSRGVVSASMRLLGSPVSQFPTRILFK